jgi:hypothetical protein
LCLPFMFISQDSSAFVCNSHHRHGFSVVFGSFFCFGRRRLEVFSDPDGGITFASWMCAEGVSFQSHYLQYLYIVIYIYIYVVIVIYIYVVKQIIYIYICIIMYCIYTVK